MRRLLTRGLKLVAKPVGDVVRPGLAALGLLLGAAMSQPSLAAQPAAAIQDASAPRPSQADFSGEAVSAEARQVADWVVGSANNGDLPFIIVDKAQAKLFLFNSRGSIQAASPVLLGLARGDDSPPGVGDLPLAMISPGDRITPAGRFVASPGTNLSGQDILWVDYNAAISLHRATDRKAGLTAKSRLERLTSASTLDNRISHGCINVSVEFYDRFIRSTFRATNGIVYVLPETRSVRQVFNMSGANEHAQAEARNARQGG